MIEALVGLSDTNLRPESYLSILASDPDFKSFVSKAAREAASRNPPILFCVEDVSRCLKGLYHTVSKGQHGMMLPGYLQVPTSPDMAGNDRIAICLFFEFFDFPYVLVNSNGDPILESNLASGWFGKPISSFRPQSP